jgi:hypothetical protein
MHFECAPAKPGLHQGIAFVPVHLQSIPGVALYWCVAASLRSADKAREYDF